VKGDRVEIVVDAGGEARTYEVAATRAGRRVDVRVGRGVVEVTELTRGGTTVRTARFMASRVLALVEHPADESQAADDAETSLAARPRGRRAAADEAASASPWDELALPLSGPGGDGPQ